MKKNVVIKILIPALIIIFLSLALIFYLQKNEVFKPHSKDSDFSQCLDDFSEKECDSVFISMFDASSFTEDEFKAYLDRETFIFKDLMLTKNDLSLFPEIANKLSNKEITGKNKKVYFFIDPVIMHDLSKGTSSLKRNVKKYLSSTISANSDIEFDLTFPYYFFGHYDSVKISTNYVESITAIVNELSQYTNVSFNYPTDIKWLTENKYIFEDESDSRLKEDISSWVFCNIFAAENFKTGAADIIERAKLFESTIKNNPSGYEAADLSNYNIVIFGDSIFDMSHDDTSIQNIVGNFSKADIINKAKGGMCASNNSIYSLEYFAGNLKDIDSLKKEINEIYSDDETLVFIIEYGINDYINAADIDDSEDKYNTGTYKGAIRTAVSKLREAYPDCKIVMMAPGLMVGMDYGTIEFGENKTVLSDYRSAAEELSGELNLSLFDYEKEAGITADNMEGYYVTDGIHYNEDARLLIGKALIEFLNEIK